MIKCGHTSFLIESTLTEQKKTMQSCWYLAKLLVSYKVVSISQSCWYLAKLLVSHQLGFWNLDLMRRESVMFFTWISVNVYEFLLVCLVGGGDELQYFDFPSDVFPDSRWLTSR